MGSFYCEDCECICDSKRNGYNTIYRGNGRGTNICDACYDKMEDDPDDTDPTREQRDNDKWLDAQDLKQSCDAAMKHEDAQ